MKRILSVAVLLVLAACGDPVDDADSDTGTDFTLTGTVVDARAGVELPEGVPEPGVGTAVDPQTGGDDSDEEIEPASLAVETEDEVGACARDDDGYTVYVTTDTAFDPLTIPSAGGFPVNLEGRRVDVNGMYFSGDEGDCTLVAESITVGAAAEVEEPADGTSPPDTTQDPDTTSDPDATTTPGPRPDDAEGTAEPEASP